MNSNMQEPQNKVVETAFEQLIDDMNISTEQRDNIFKKMPTIEEKMRFIELMKKSAQLQPKQNCQTFIEEFKQSTNRNITPEAKVFQELHQYIKADNQFATRFIDANGLDLLFKLLYIVLNKIQACGQESFLFGKQDTTFNNITNVNQPSSLQLLLQQLSKKQQDDVKKQIEAEYKVLKNLLVCIKKLMDSKIGLQLTINNDKALTCLNRVLFDTHDDEDKDEALFIISVLSLLPPKYCSVQQILSSLDLYAVSRGQQKFLPLLLIAKQQLKFQKNQELLYPNQIIRLQRIMIIITNLTDRNYNNSIQSRIEIRKELNSVLFNEFDNRMVVNILHYIKNTCREDSHNKFHLFQQMLQKNTENTMPNGFTTQFQEYVNNPATPEYIRKDSQIRDILLLLQVREKYFASDSYDTFQYTSIKDSNIIDMESQYNLNQIIQQFCHRIQNFSIINRNHFRESMLDLMAVVVDDKSFNQDNYTYIFAGLRQFCGRLLQFKEQCDQYGPEDTLKKDSAANELNDCTLFDVLSKRNQVSQSYIVQELEKMIGYPAIDIIQKSKQITIKTQNINLRNSALKTTNALKIVQMEDFKQMVTMKDQMKEKQLIIQQLQRDITNLGKENSKLKQNASNVSSITINTNIQETPLHQPYNSNNLQEQLNVSPVQKQLPQQQSQKSLPGPPGITSTNGPPRPPTSGQQQNQQKPPGPPNSSQPPKPPGPPGPPGSQGPPGPPTTQKPGPPQAGSAQQQQQQNLKPAPIIPKKEQINTPSLPLKPLNWDNVPDKDLNDTVLQFKNDIKLTDKQLSILEQLFSQKQTKQQDTTPLIQRTTKKVISCIDGKKAYSISIGLQKFRLTIDEIFQRMLKMQNLNDTDGGIDNLALMNPSVQDIQLINQQLELEKDITKYALPEQFVIKIKVFPRVTDRIRNWQLARNFESEVLKVRPTFEIIDKFFTFILNNSQFMQLLHYLVSIGNTLNAGQPKGGLYAFKLRSFSRFFELKDCNNQPLLKCIIKFMSETNNMDSSLQLEYLSKLEQEFGTTQLQQFQNDSIYLIIQEFNIICSKMKKTNYTEEEAFFIKYLQQFNQLKDSIQQFKYNDQDNYCKTMEEFVAGAEFRLEQIVQLNSDIKKNFSHLKKRHCEAAGVSFDDIVQYFFEFAEQLHKVKQMIIEEYQQKELQLKQQLQQQNKIQSIDHLLKNPKQKDQQTTDQDIEDKQQGDSLMTNLMNNFLQGGKRWK